MNFLPSRDRSADEYNSGLIVDHIQTLEAQNEIHETDLDQFARWVLQAELPRETTQDLMYKLGLVLKDRNDEWLREQGESLVNAAYVKREMTEHSLPDSDTATIIIDTVRRDFENSLFLEIQAPPEEENPFMPQATESDLELSGIFRDEREIPPIASESSTSVHFEEDLPTITIPSPKDPRPDIIHRLKTTGNLSDPDIRVRVRATHTFSQVTDLKRANFEFLTRKEMIEGVEDLIDSINIFFREVHKTNPINEREKLYFDQILELNDTAIRKILIIERKILDLLPELREIAEVRSRRLKQLDHLEHIESELREAETTPADIQYLQVIRLRFISFIKDVLYEQEAYPKKVKDLQKKLTELSEELLSLQITFPESW